MYKDDDDLNMYDDGTKQVIGGVMFRRVWKVLAYPKWIHSIVRNKMENKIHWSNSHGTMTVVCVVFLFMCFLKSAQYI